MLAGEFYDCTDPELMERWHLAKNLVREFNQLPSQQLQAKRAVLKKLLGGFGEKVWITAPFYVDYGNNIYLGNNCEINMNCTFLDDNIIKIGDNALIAPNVQIYAAFHPTRAKERFTTTQLGKAFAFAPNISAPVTIGKDVWLGGGAIILPGVTIGDNVVIGAGSVVTKDIPAHKIACGNPCRVIRDNS